MQCVVSKTPQEAISGAWEPSLQIRMCVPELGLKITSYDSTSYRIIAYGFGSRHEALDGSLEYPDIRSAQLSPLSRAHGRAASYSMAHRSRCVRLALVALPLAEAFVPSARLPSTGMVVSPSVHTSTASIAHIANHRPSIRNRAEMRRSAPDAQRPRARALSMLQKEGVEKSFFPFSTNEDSPLKLFASKSTKGKDTEVNVSHVAHRGGAPGY